MFLLINFGGLGATLCCD